LDFLPDVFERQVRAGEDSARQPFALADESEEQVLGLNRDASQLAGLVASEEEDAPGPFRVPFEHPDYLRESRSCCGHNPCNHIIRQGCPLFYLGLPPQLVRRRAFDRGSGLLVHDSAFSRPLSSRTMRSHARASRGLCVAMIEVNPKS